MAEPSRWHPMAASVQRLVRVSCGVAVACATVLIAPPADATSDETRERPTLTAFAPPPLPNAAPNRAAKRAALRRAFGPSALTYLEGLKGKKKFRAPSEIDDRYTLAFYVNVAARGPRAQRMWVLQRDKIGGPWRLAMHDTAYWKRRGLPGSMTPTYSWPVSTGRKYRGDNRSGPTPQGVFAMDERRYRTTRGYHAPGMINAMFIDLHYSSGRASGVAFHGTTRSMYRRLGRIDSHGCIRMTQANARAVLNRMQGRDGVLDEAMRWGEVPRFWRRGGKGTRRGYVRDGTILRRASDSGASTAANGTSDGGDVLTKTGYRAIAVMFWD
ncbi:MAG: L,D-transpeptidase [Pseudomonadota bacterium]